MKVSCQSIFSCRYNLRNVSSPVNGIIKMVDLRTQLEKGIKLQHEGRLNEAADCYADILANDPTHADANHLRGLVAHQQGYHDAALVFIDKAIAECPEVSMYHANRGRILKAIGNTIAATSAYATALRLKPGDAITLSDLAGAFLDSGDIKLAGLFSSRAVALAPGLAVAHYNYGLSAKLSNQVKSAYRAFRKSLDLEPEFSAALFELGQLHQMENDNELAEKCYRSALEVDSTFFEAHVNLGNILRENFEVEEAIIHYRAALAIRSDKATVHANLGVALQELGQAQEALEAYDKSLKLDFDNPETQRNRSQLLLQMGQYAEGWEAFEWRWKTEHFRTIRREWQRPEWNGESGSDITVLVHSEQGFGDTIQFSRYLPIIAPRVGRVLAECPLQLVDLISRCEGVDDVISTGAPLPEYDFHIPMMSLPRVCGTSLDNVPAQVPYLRVTSRLREEWADRIGGKGQIKVGVVWKGSYFHKRNAWRSPGIAELKPLFELTEIDWISLQKDDEAKDIQFQSISTDILAIGSTLRDFSDTAAVITHLDLVITPDTAVAHLAGALNYPVWLMLPHVAEWRWLMERHDTPWYPSMRLFRQTNRGDWSSLISNMVSQLKNMIRK